MADITITLTFEQAGALIAAASNTLDHPDAADGTFPDSREQAEAFEAYRALRVAWAKEAQRLAGIR